MVMIKQVKKGWRADFWLGSNRIRKSFPSKKIAEVFEVTKKNEYLQGKFIPNSKRDRTPFNNFVEEYYRLYASISMVNPKTNEFYRLEQLKKFFGAKPISDIKPRDIEEWKTSMASQCQPATLNRALTTLKGLFNKEIEWGKLEHNPAQKIGKLREANQRVRYLTEEEISKLLEFAKPRLRDFIVLALNTGMRKANLIGLIWEDIDFRNGVIHILKTKSGKAYDVPLNNAVLGLLKSLVKGKTPAGKVLNTCNLKREWENAIEASGVKNCRVHDLRHTFASHLAMKGIDLFTVSQLLGHADIKMTQRYAHLAPNHKKIAVNMLNLTEPKKTEPIKVETEFSTN
jgi:integrase